MIVDDDPISREVIQILLESRGCRVQPAATGEDALRLLSHKVPPPDVILVDQHMPGLAGEALLLELRTRCPPPVQVFAMSAGTPTHRDLAAYDGFLQKPFSMEQLEGALGWADHGVRVATKTTQVGPLDEAVFKQLNSTMPAQAVADLYLLCMEDIQQRLKSMREYAESGQDEAYRQEAHTIKGGCGMIGAMEIHQVATEMEMHGLQRGGEGLSHKLASAIERLERVLLTHTIE